METLLYQYNPWWEEKFELKSIYLRNNYLNKLKQYLDNRSIIFLTGLRRVGKTTLMKLIIKHLIEKKIEPVKILYISMDDYALSNFTINEILTEYRKIHKLTIDKKVYIFLDEITYKKDYQIQLKNLYDSQNVKMFTSSSSSSLLKDSKALLTGRTTTLEIQPFDFIEYLDFKKINIKKRDSYLLESYFKNYIKDGGMPEHIINPVREYLVNLVDDIIQKDIIAFHSIKYSQTIKDFFLLLMERAGKQISVNKLANILKISPDTASRYLKYFEETYLVYLIPRWGKTNEKILSPKKIYASDLGIRYLFHGERDLGSYFENYIYLKIKSYNPYYLYQENAEIDFYLSNDILIESKFFRELNEKQEKLFNKYNAREKIIIDNIEKMINIEKVINN